MDHTILSARDLNLYYGENHALKNIMIDLPERQITALIGPSGCGKSTFLRTINRMNDLIPGVKITGSLTYRGEEVYAPGRDVTDLRRHIGLATQDVLLYSDTIEGNIAYGDGSIKINDVVKFARYSSASDFIAKMPEGYDTIVGERGVGLSGGQKQRISLARALAIRPSILILDDTTSAVDMETEKQIQHSLKELDFPCTKVIIAQRISTTRDADRIIVLRDGYIEESGTHEELLAKKGYYYELVKLQTGLDEL